MRYVILARSVGILESSPASRKCAKRLLSSLTTLRMRQTMSGES